MSSSDVTSAAERGREVVRAHLTALGWSRKGTHQRGPVLHAQCGGSRRTLWVSGKASGAWQQHTRYGAAVAAALCEGLVAAS